MWTQGLHRMVHTISLDLGLCKCATAVHARTGPSGVLRLVWEKPEEEWTNRRPNVNTRSALYAGWPAGDVLSADARWRSFPVALHAPSTVDCPPVERLLRCLLSYLDAYLSSGQICHASKGKNGWDSPWADFDPYVRRVSLHMSLV